MHILWNNPTWDTHINTNLSLFRLEFLCRNGLHDDTEPDNGNSIPNTISTGKEGA